MLQIKTPCTASWEKMDQLENGNRFCHDCKKVVHDLSALSKADGLKLYNDLGGSMCARMVNPGFQAMPRVVQQASGNRLRLNMAQLRVAASAAAFVLLSQSPLMAQGAPILSSALNKDGKPMEEVQAIEEGVFIFGDTVSQERIKDLPQIQNSKSPTPSADKPYELPEGKSPIKNEAGREADWQLLYGNSHPPILWANIELVMLGMISSDIVYMIPEEELVKKRSLAVIPYELLPVAFPLNEYEARPVGLVQQTPEKKRPVPSPYFLAASAVPLRRRRYRPGKPSQNA